MVKLCQFDLEVAAETASAHFAHIWMNGPFEHPWWAHAACDKVNLWTRPPTGCSSTYYHPIHCFPQGQKRRPASEKGPKWLVTQALKSFLFGIWNHGPQAAPHKMHQMETFGFLNASCIGSKASTFWSQFPASARKSYGNTLSFRFCPRKSRAVAAFRLRPLWPGLGWAGVESAFRAR